MQNKFNSSVDLEKHKKHLFILIAFIKNSYTYYIRNKKRIINTF